MTERASHPVRGSTPLGSAMRTAIRLGAVAMIVVLTWRVMAARQRANAPTAKQQASEFLASVGYSGGSAMAEGPPAFTDITAESGLTFVHDNDALGAFALPERIGGGCAFLDYDDDGDLDILLAGGGSVSTSQRPQHCALYRNDSGRFTDVSRESRANVPGPTFGLTCADYDRDGDVDVFITRLGADVLLQNAGNGSFQDVSTSAGVADAGWGASAAFADIDRDGWLDLYVTRYVDWRPEIEQLCFAAMGLRDYCHPVSYHAPSAHRLYRNRRDGTFEDVTASSGIGAARGNGLGVVAADFDADGWVDFYVANDGTPAFLWRNLGDGRFENVAEMRGCAYDGRGVAIAGMGVACDDFDSDGDPDLLVTNIRGQSNLVLQNDRGYFTDVSSNMGVPRWSLLMTAFGVCAFDQDHDGALDFFIANGAVNLAPAALQSDDPYAEPQQFIRFKEQRLIDASAGSGADFVAVGRGAATGDFDGDGDLDLLVSANGGRARLLRNNAPQDHHWIMLDIRHGEPATPAIGAEVEVHAGDRAWRRTVRPNIGYLSSSDARVHIGLGAASAVDRLVIKWPDGSRTERAGVAVDQVLRLVQDQEEPSKP